MIETAQRVIEATRQHWEPVMERRDLFGEVKPYHQRSRHRVLMHVIDAGDNCCGDPSDAVIARFRCSACGAETDWLQVRTVTEAKRGVPCEKCNGG